MEKFVLDGRLYKRGFSEIRGKLSETLSKKYGKNTAYITPSGMCSIKTIFEIIAKINITSNEKFYFLVGHELYGDVKKELKRIQEWCLNCEVHFFDIRTNKLTETGESILDFAKKMKNKIKLLYVETVSNPSGCIVDWTTVNPIKKETNCLVVADNTWCSVELFNPFKFSVDVVVNSLTKYYSGGSHIMGALIFDSNLSINSKKFMDLVYQEIKTYHISDNVLKVVQRKTFELQKRMDVACKRVEIALKFFNEKGFKVIHPSLSTHPTKDRFKYLKKSPPVFLVYLPVSRNRQTKYCKKNLDYGTSFGKFNSSVDPYPIKGNSALFDIEKSKKKPVNGVWIRVSIGFGETYSQFNTFLNTIAKIVN